MKELIRLLFGLFYFGLQIYSLIWQASWDAGTHNSGAAAWVPRPKVAAIPKIVSAVLGVFMAPLLQTIFDVAAFSTKGLPSKELKNNITLFTTYRNIAQTSHMKHEVDTSEYDTICPNTVKQTKVNGYGLNIKLRNFRRVIMKTCLSNRYQVAQLFFTTLWTVIGTINSGWWWRYDELVSTSINEVTGLPYCTGNQCTVYFLVWDPQYVPLVMKCFDMFLLGVLLSFTSVHVIFNAKQMAMLASPMFWLNQSVMPTFTMIGSFIIRAMQLKEFETLNYITFFHPVRWICLYSLMNSYLTDGKAVRLGKGNEIRAVIITGIINVTIMILLYSFTFFSFEWDPSDSWLQTKDHLDLEESFITETQGYFHNGLWSCVYYTFVTLSTVGYGDFSPKTNLGRVFCVTFIFWMLYYFPKLLDELSTARDEGIVKHGSIPNTRKMKDTVVVFSKFDDRNIKDFASFLFSIESANHLVDSRDKVFCVIAIAPSDNVDKLAFLVSRTKLTFRVCVVQGDVAFGSQKIESLFSRLDIACWTKFREVIFLGEFDHGDHIDTTLCSRLNMSRLHAVHVRLDASIVHENQLTTIVYDNIEPVLLSRTSRGNALVMSLIKAAAIGKSLTTVPGLQALIFPIFGISQEIENDCIKPLLDQGASTLSNYELVQRGLMSYLQRIPSYPIFDDLPFEVVAQALYHLFSIVVVGASNKTKVGSNIDKYMDILKVEKGDLSSSASDEDFDALPPSWNFWINPIGHKAPLSVLSRYNANQTGLLMESQWHDLIVIANKHQIEVLDQSLVKRETDLRATLAYFATQKDVGRNKTSVFHSKSSHEKESRQRSCLFTTAKGQEDRKRKESIVINNMMCLQGQSDGIDKVTLYSKRIDKALDTLTHPHQPFILILGTCRAWQDIVQVLIQDDSYNIIHVIASGMPDFENIWVNTRDFDWSHNNRYYCIHSTRCDKASLFSDIGVDHDLCAQLLVLPEDLLVEEQEAGESSEDSHVFATLLRLKSFMKQRDLNTRIVMNLENRTNTTFFSSLLENENVDTSQEVMNIDMLGPDLKLHSSRAVMSGNLWVDGMANIIGYNWNIFPFCVNPKVMYHLLGVDDILRTSSHTNARNKRGHGVDVSEGVVLLGPHDIDTSRGVLRGWKAALPGPVIGQYSYKVSYKSLYEHLIASLNCIPIGVHRTVFHFSNGKINKHKKEEYVIITPPNDLVLDYNSTHILDRVYVIPTSRPTEFVNPDTLMSVAATTL